MSTGLDTLKLFGSNGGDVITEQGNLPGRRVFIIGGMHGNELTGILVVHQLCKDLENKKLQIKKGALSFALGNPEAIKRNHRMAHDEIDMNRQFTIDISSKKSELDGVKRAQKIAHQIENSDIVIDIHSTNRPSLPFISTKIDSAHEKIYQWFDRSYVLEDPSYILAGHIASSDEYADYKGAVGICLETGFAEDISKVQSVMTSIKNLLISEELIEGIVPETQKKSYPCYTLSNAVMYDERGFVFAKQIKGHSFEKIKKDEVFAYQGSSPVTAPYDGVIVFPASEKFFRIGRPACYIAKNKKSTD